MPVPVGQRAFKVWKTWVRLAVSRQQSHLKSTVHQSITMCTTSAHTVVTSRYNDNQDQLPIAISISISREYYSSQAILGKSIGLESMSRSSKTVPLLTRRCVRFGCQGRPGLPPSPIPPPIPSHTDFLRLPNTLLMSLAMDLEPLGRRRRSLALLPTLALWTILENMSATSW